MRRIAGLIEILSSEGKRIAVHDAADLAGRDPGSHPDNFGAGVVMLPAGTEDVQAIVRACAQLSLPIVPHGGRTGLVGGTVSHPGMVAVSTERMNRIEEIDPLTGVAVVQAGVTLEALQRAAADYGLEPGIDIGARGTATIGGMIATNAGGIQAFRHGVMRQRVLGLEAVTGDGRVFSDMTRVIKSTSGYDIKQLLIGAEGTLGLITRAVLQLTPLPAARATALVALRDVAAGVEIARALRAPGLPDLLACEMMWQNFLQMNAASHGAQLPASLLDAPATLLIELAGSSPAAAMASLETQVADLFETGLITDAVLAQSEAQRAKLWHLREDMSVFGRLYPGYSSFDVSLPAPQADPWVRLVSERLEAIEPGISPLVFGHVADGNLHVIPRRGNYTPELKLRVEAAICRDLVGMGGAISAEHGIGTAKRAAFEAFVPQGKRDMIALVKRALDPQGLFNPGKILPPGPGQ